MWYPNLILYVFFSPEMTDRSMLQAIFAIHIFSAVAFCLSLVFLKGLYQVSALFLWAQKSNASSHILLEYIMFHLSTLHRKMKYDIYILKICEKEHSIFVYPKFTWVENENSLFSLIVFFSETYCSDETLCVSTFGLPIICFHNHYLHLHGRFGEGASIF